MTTLDVERLIRAAEMMTGLADFGEDSFMTSLDRLLYAAKRDAGVTFDTQNAFIGGVILALRNRLYIQAYLKTHPDIAVMDPASPVIILGMPRTGTTLLFNLLAKDARFRWFSNWEGLAPAPPPTSIPDNRREQSVIMHRQLRKVAPDLRLIHETAPDAPEECGYLFMNSFETRYFSLSHDVGSYLDWLDSRDRAASYAYYRVQLAILQHQRGSERWLLKSPEHIWSIDSLLATFPDAAIIQTHRDPLMALPSFCSLVAAQRTLCGQAVDRHRLGEEMSAHLSTGLERCLASRVRAGEERFHDVQYRDLMQDPIAVVRAIYHRLDLPVAETVIKAMRHHLAEMPQHKYGVHRYSLDDFGLEVGAVRARFRSYTDRFDPPPEQSLPFVSA